MTAGRREDGPTQTTPFVEALRTVLIDPALRTRLGEAGVRRAAGLTWEATAAGTLDALVDEAVAGKRPGR
jgi:glycosyltransferase involved in cell wall biosynthesis